MSSVPTASRRGGIDAEPLQAVVVRVRTTTGAIEPGIGVQFASIPATSAGAAPSVLIRSPGSGPWTTAVAQATDAPGEATAEIKFGTRAGAGGIAVSIPELGIADPFAVTIMPGVPIALTIAPKDPAIRAGASNQVRGTLLDRYSNGVTTGITYSATSTPNGAAAVDPGGPEK